MVSFWDVPEGFEELAVLEEADVPEDELLLVLFLGSKMLIPIITAKKIKIDFKQPPFFFCFLGATLFGATEGRLTVVVFVLVVACALVGVPQFGQNFVPSSYCEPQFVQNAIANTSLSIIKSV